MKITVTLLKVLVAKLGEEASAKFILENDFLNKTEEEQALLVQEAIGERRETETSAVETKTEAEPVFEEFEDIKGFVEDDIPESVKTLLEDSSFDERVQTAKPKITLPKKQSFWAKPQNKNERHTWRRIFGRR